MGIPHLWEKKHTAKITMLDRMPRSCDWRLGYSGEVFLNIFPGGVWGQSSYPRQWPLHRSRFFWNGCVWNGLFYKENDHELIWINGIWVYLFSDETNVRNGSQHITTEYRWVNEHPNIINSVRVWEVWTRTYPDCIHKPYLTRGMELSVGWGKSPPFQCSQTARPAAVTPGQQQEMGSWMQKQAKP